MSLLLTIQFVLAVLLQVLIGTCGYIFCDSIPVPNSTEIGVRLAFTIQWSFPMVLILIFASYNVMIRRATNPALLNPLAGNEHTIQAQKNILTNTVEQTMISILLMLIGATLFNTTDTMKIIPMYSLMFFIGRVLFIIGYSIHPLYRSLGMTINFSIMTVLFSYIIHLMYKLNTTNVIKTEL